MRTALHPAEEIRAFATMAEGGAPETAIARAFAVTARHVRGRMKLAGLPAPILDALAADEITLDAAAANTLGSPERALEVFEALQGSWGADRPAEIRHRVLGEAQELGSRLGLFVGRAAYEAAGGAITEDLFGEQVYFEDAELLARLAQAKLDEAAARVKAEGWKWVEASFEPPDWHLLQKHARTYPERADHSAEDAARYDALAEAIEAATDADRAEFAALEAAQTAEIWTERQKVFAGVFLYLDHRGEIRREAGLIRADDRKPAEAAGVCRPDLHRQAVPKGPYLAKLTEDLKRLRPAAVQAALLEKPGLALGLLAFALSSEAGGLPLGLGTVLGQNRLEADDGLRLDPRLDAVPAADTSAAAFAAFRAKPQRERMARLTQAIARLFAIGLASPRTTLAERIASLSGAEIRKVWTPTRAF